MTETKWFISIAGFRGGCGEPVCVFRREDES